MLGRALTFFVIAIIGAILGFGGVAAGAVAIARILFLALIVLFVLSLLGALASRGRTTIDL